MVTWKNRAKDNNNRVLMPAAVKEVKNEELIYIILTFSGKPVYYSKGEEQEIACYTAVIQAIVSCFESSQELRCIESEAGQIVLHLANPLILAAIDRRQHSVSQLKAHLSLLHAQILSVLTKQQLEKQFVSRPGVDLRPMLGGTEVYLNALSQEFTRSSPWTWLNALECLELRRSSRAKLNAALLESRAQSSLLYGLMVSNSRLSGVLRPKKHSLHPPDLHLLFSMLFNTSAFIEGEHWVPICFPKFNPNGFLYAYIRLVVSPHTYLVLVSPNRQGFFEMQSVGFEILERIESSVIRSVSEATMRGRLSCSALDIAPIEFFIYKSHSHVQYLQSTLSEAVPKDVYLQVAKLQASMSSKRQRICWSMAEKGSVLGWHTPAFELYCYTVTMDESTNDPVIPDAKELVSNAIKKLVAWIRKHETRLFIVDGATF